MGNIEVNTSHGDRLARIILSLPLGVLLVALDLPYLFFISFYLVVSGITGISLEYNLLNAFKGNKARELKANTKSTKRTKAMN